MTFRAFPAFNLSITWLPQLGHTCNGSINENVTINDAQCVVTGSKNNRTDMLIQTGLSAFTDEIDSEAVQALWTDNLGVGESSPESLILSGVYVAGQVSKTLSTALFGLSIRTVHYSFLPQLSASSFLVKFRAFYQIESLSLSYTAGSHSLQLPPSLILGGYDSTRVLEDTILEASIDSRTVGNNLFQVGLDMIGITINAINTVSAYPTNASNTSLAVNLDLVTPQIWLPETICATFETAFGLQWDEKSKFYFVNESTHFSLIRQNVSVSFSFLSGVDGQDRERKIKVFKLAYATSLGLNLSYPLIESWKYYFPLKRSKSHLITLGRAFFQETHISIDFDHLRFNLSQARMEHLPPELVQIGSPTVLVESGLPSNTHNSTISQGAYAGIGVGIGIFILLIGVGIVAIFRGWGPLQQYRSKNNEREQTRFYKPELHNNAIPRVEAMEKERVELATEEPSHESTGVIEIFELDGRNSGD